MISNTVLDTVITQTDKFQVVLDTVITQTDKFKVVFHTIITQTDKFQVLFIHYLDTQQLAYSLLFTVLHIQQITCNYNLHSSNNS